MKGSAVRIRASASRSELVSAAGRGLTDSFAGQPRNVRHVRFRSVEDPRKRIQTLRTYAEWARAEDPDIADRLWRVAEAEESRLQARRREVPT